MVTDLGWGSLPSTLAVCAAAREPRRVMARARHIVPWRIVRTFKMEVETGVTWRDA
jgi:hypothetical protein